VFVSKPEAQPKDLKILLTACTSSLTGFQKIAESAANKLILSFAFLLQFGVSSPSSVALFNISCKGSIAKIKNIGESGSPCLKPVLCLNHLSWAPFKRTAELEVSSKVDTQALHLFPNPIFSSTSCRKSHLIVSKALAILSFKKSVGFFALCSSLMRFCAYRKLSYMLLLLIKALWALDTKLSDSKESLAVSNLEISFAKLWDKLIGLKSPTVEASSLFGNSTMWALFSRLKCWSNLS